jgi:hypothetical protein
MGIGSRDTMSEVRHLLVAYDEFLNCSRRPRPWWVRGTHEYAVAHVRTVLEPVCREYVRRAAVGASSTSSDQDDRERLGRFIASLPPKPSAARAIVLGVLVILLAQALSGVVGLLEQTYPEVRVTSGTRRSELLEALSDVASLSVSNVVKIAGVIVDAGLAGAAVVLTIAGLAAWLILRPLANGVAAARKLRNTNGVLSRLEQKVLSAAGVEPRRGSTLDLVVPALLAVPAFLLGVAMAREYFDGIPETELGLDVGETTSVEFLHPLFLLVLALALGVAGWVRLTWLAYRYLPVRRRTAGRDSEDDRRRRALSARPTMHYVATWLLATVLVIAGVVIYAALDTAPTDVHITLKTSIPATLRNGEIGLDVRTSETSEFDSATLRGYSGLAPDEGELDDAVSSTTHADVVLLLTPPQRRWLRTESRDAAPWLEVLVFDPAANKTRLRVILD